MRGRMHEELDRSRRCDRSIVRSIDCVRSRDFRTFRDRRTIDPRPVDYSARFVRVCDVQGARALRFNAHHRWDGGITQLRTV